MENPSFKLVITGSRGGLLTCLMENERAVQLDYSDGSSIVGNIYAGKVKNISKNLEAAFIDIGTPLPAFFSIPSDPSPVYLDGREHSRMKEGDEVLVKVKKDAHKTKGPTVMTRFSERKDPEFVRKAAFVRAPGLIAAAPPFWQFLARQTASSGADLSIITDLQDVYEALTGQRPPAAEEYVKKLPKAFQRAPEPVRMEGTEIPVTFYQDPSLPLSAVFSLETAVSDASARKVWLKSGGYLVIDQTEAMTVIDVNSGKNEKNRAKEDLILSTDMEAVREAMRQIRLRNLSGIILIDLIDVKTEETQASLLKELRMLASLDPVKTQVVDITKLNLAEIVRKKSGRPFAAQLGQRKSPGF